MSVIFGPHRFDAGEYDAAHADEFRGAEFVVRDLRDARFVDCDLRGAKIVDALLGGVDVSGYVEGLVVNGVDVTDYVAAELDRRHPERVQLREIEDADGFRGMWDTVERLWAEADVRAERLPEEVRQERVGREWSYVETLRHLVFITDSWASRTVLDEESPFHRLALPQTAFPAADAAALGIDLVARPSYDEVKQVLAGRRAVVRGIVEGLTDQDLGRPCLRSPAPGYPDESRAVFECLAVVMEEECEHYRFATRDLAVLETREGQSEKAAAG